ncbi:sensor histidine kinase [Lysobacter sp. CA199]|uniref:sensor histidine kinase n=1 Tax=Lysobacter sp. CA199 TaxID=3455608 RepID=UPI003F8D364F
MTTLLRRTVLQPMNLPALLTWLAVALSLRYAQNPTSPVLWLAMLGFAAAFLAHDFLPDRRVYARAVLFALEAASALTVCWFASRGGASPALLVVMVAHMSMVYPRGVVIVLSVAINLALYLVLVHAHSPAPLVITLIFAGFQSFAALIARYARSAEQTRDQLALVNADLLATRALLADSARDAERLRMARELHDVAGHKLTAMMLNLRLLAAEPDLGQRREVQLAQQLASELLGDIRGVVQALRDARGLDLATALRALAAPMPKPTLDLSIDADIHLTDPALAETLLRVVQEALTNSARHAEADRVSVDIRRDGATLRILIEDDGRVRGALHEGNGLAGMRERVAAAGGIMALSHSPRGAMRIEASFPLNGAIHPVAQA